MSYDFFRYQYSWHRFRYSPKLGKPDSESEKCRFSESKHGDFGSGGSHFHLDIPSYLPGKTDRKHLYFSKHEKVLNRNAKTSNDCREEVKRLLVDKIFDSFEDYCCEKSVIGQEELAMFLNTFPGADHIGVDNALELAKVALERSWMKWPKRLEQLARSCSTEQIMQQFQALPRSSDLLSLDLFAEISDRPKQELVSSEYRLRAIFGDNLHIDAYKEKYGLSLDPIKAKLTPMVKNGSSEFTAKGIVLHGQCEFGRRRSFEPDHIDLHLSSTGCRVIVAPRNDVRVSRRHLTVQVLNPEFAYIQNTSNINVLGIKRSRFNDSGMHEETGILDPNESKVFRFPFTIILPSRCLLFCNASSLLKNTHLALP